MGGMSPLPIHKAATSLALEEWRKQVVSNRLKGWEELAFKQSHNSLEQDDNAHHAEPFTALGLSRRIVRWIAADDQAINVVESPLFREILLYASTSPHPLTNKDILHRTHAHDLLVREYEMEIQRLRDELKAKALGRISFTCDLWSSQDLSGYFALSVHYCKRDSQERLTLSSRLGAFRNLTGQHTGRNLAEEFVAVLEELDIIDKPGCITIDNASNCGTMMEEITRILTAKGIPFHREGNHLRCFPHVVNISVRHGLSALTEIQLPTTSSASERAGLGASQVACMAAAASIPIDPLLLPRSDTLPDASTNSALQDDPGYAAALQDDPIKMARDLISVCRSSGQRREELQRTIAEGNQARRFGPGVVIPQAQLLRDVDTRWSSTFLMIDRLLELYPAVEAFLQKPGYDTEAAHLLTPTELDVLEDIRGYLLIPHRVQELLSADQSPTASMVLPAYEELLDLLKLARSKYPKISHAIDASIAVLERYMGYTRQNRVYALAMMINPAVKISWLKRNWNAEEVQAAESWMIEAMLAYCTRERQEQSQLGTSTAACAPGPSSSLLHLAARSASGRSSPTLLTPPSAPPSRSSRAQSAGFASLQELRRELSSSSIPSTTSDSNSQGERSTHASQRESEHDSEAEHEARLVEADKRTVEDELQRYVQEELSNWDVDLLYYWDTHARSFPYLFRVALDILPVQASSVTSERVFSSSKETDTLRRTGLDAAMMEILQVLKYAINQEAREARKPRVTPPPSRSASEATLRHDEMIDSAEASRLIHSGRYCEFLRLVHQVHGDSA
ncbi:hypothetical protein BN946_scf184917.g4 [Trametes cinnabarina]|uniref:HAT C-terminal dimerisation domain-containing protein n=1 Tax=Pycnoporus cinnabarinus TaxID=5643 RepID=A0A060SV34_PYCCI|nr:hypothetical protein BN946_scf184917.g4 [Trametes cinnabarina]